MPLSCSLRNYSFEIAVVGRYSTFWNLLAPNLSSIHHSVNFKRNDHFSIRTKPLPCDIVCSLTLKAAERCKTVCIESFICGCGSWCPLSSVSVILVWTFIGVVNVIRSERGWKTQICSAWVVFWVMFWITWVILCLNKSWSVTDLVICHEEKLFFYPVYLSEPLTPWFLYAE